MVSRCLGSGCVEHGLLRAMMAAMERVGVRQLRQNASKVVSEVAQHGPVVVTVNGREAVLISPLGDQHRWVPAQQALRYWDTLGPDPDWASELQEQRDSDLITWDR